MSEPPVLRGSRVLLRPWREGDKAARIALGRDPGITRAFGGDTREGAEPLMAEEVEAWYERERAREHGWAVELAGRWIGLAFLHSLEAHDRRATYAVGIHDPQQIGQGLGTEITRLMLGYAFVELGLHRVGLRVLAYNERAIRCFERCGFRPEGVERESGNVDGEWYDDVMMGVLAEEFRALA